jgi:hypothetical protein
MYGYERLSMATKTGRYSKRFFRLLSSYTNTVTMTMTFDVALMLSQNLRD